MDPGPNTDRWLIFEDDSEGAAEYADFDEQVELSPEDRAAHDEYVSRVAQEYGFPLSTWAPVLPNRVRR